MILLLHTYLFYFVTRYFMLSHSYSIQSFNFTSIYLYDLEEILNIDHPHIEQHLNAGLVAL